MKNIVYIVILCMVVLSCHKAKMKSVTLVPNTPEPYVQDRKTEFKGASETNFKGEEGAGTGSSYSSGYIESQALKDTADNPIKDSIAVGKQPVYKK